MEKLINKGTGAGGYKTTLNGKLFERAKLKIKDF